MPQFKYIYKKVNSKDLDDILSFKTGLLLNDAKSIAKDLSKNRDDVSHSNALLITAMANGCFTARAWDQAVDDLLYEQHGLRLNQLSFIQSHDANSLLGVRVTAHDGYHHDYLLDAMDDTATIQQHIFDRGTASEILQMLDREMPPALGEDQFFRDKCSALLSALLPILVQLRDAGHLRITWSNLVHLYSPASLCFVGFLEDCKDISHKFGPLAFHKMDVLRCVDSAHLSCRLLTP